MPRNPLTLADVPGGYGYGPNPGGSLGGFLNSLEDRRFAREQSRLNEQQRQRQFYLQQEQLKQNQQALGQKQQQYQNTLDEKAKNAIKESAKNWFGTLDPDNIDKKQMYTAVDGFTNEVAQIPGVKPEDIDAIQRYTFSVMKDLGTEKEGDAKALFKQYHDSLLGPQKKAADPTTAMGAFLKQNPNATPDEIADFAQKLKGKGIKINTDGSIEIGGPQNDITVASKSAAQKEIMSINDQYSRVRDIAQSYQRKFTEVPTKFEKFWDATKEKFGGKLSPEDEKELREYTTFRSRVVNNINRYIKYITGAQMSEKEADRLRLPLPDTGEGGGIFSVFKGDSHSQFQAKLDNVMRELGLANARYNYYLNKGFSDVQIKALVSSEKAIPIGEVEYLMSERENQLKKQNPNMSTEDIASILQKEFMGE